MSDLKDEVWIKMTDEELIQYGRLGRPSSTFGNKANYSMNKLSVIGAFENKMKEKYGTNKPT